MKKNARQTQSAPRDGGMAARPDPTPDPTGSEFGPEIAKLPVELRDMLWAYTTQNLFLWKLVVLDQHKTVIARLPLAVRLEYTFPYPYKPFGGFTCDTTMFVLTSAGWVMQYRKREKDRDRPPRDPRPLTWRALCATIHAIRAQLPSKRYPIDFMETRAEYISVWQNVRAFVSEHDSVTPFSVTERMTDAIRRAEEESPTGCLHRREGMYE